jgi:hypothetical protein
MIWPDGRVSDMANLTRIKDAAEVACTSDRDPRRLRWERSDSLREARTRALPRPVDGDARRKVSSVPASPIMEAAE